MQLQSSKHSNSSKLSFNFLGIVIFAFYFFWIFNNHDSKTSPTLISSNEVPGKLSANFSINNNGGASYSIPINVPPGIKGVEPTLKLVYSSQAGNGLLGMGFNLAGTSSITRCKAIMAIDGFSGGVLYDKNDRFCLNGQRLININQTKDYGAPGSIYHTEKESWQKVVASESSCGSGPCYFTVTTKKGITMRFGKRSDSRVLANGKKDVRVWAIDSLADRNGNYMLFKYTQPDNTGQFYPSSISYTSNESFQANRFVKFNYEPRPDTLLHYQGGSKIQTDQRLVSIQTYLKTDLVTSYNLSYGAPSSSTGRSLIHSISQCDANNTCKTPTTFQWQGLNKKFNTQSIQTTSINLTNKENNAFLQPTTLGDANGDGKMDIVLFNNNGNPVEVALAADTESKFESFQNWGAEQLSMQGLKARSLIDLNGDGLSDIFSYNPDANNISVGISDGKQFNFIDDVFKFSEQGTFEFLQLGEVNGDGLPDIIAFFEDIVLVALSTGTFKSGANSFTIEKSYSTSDFSAATWLGLPRVVTDLNGDGRIDIVGFGSNGVKVGINTGKEFLTTDTTLWNNNFTYFKGSRNEDFYEPRYTFSDVNGDGLTDILSIDTITKENKVALSTGKEFLPPATWSSFRGTPRTRQLADVNGDHVADIIAFEKGINSVDFSTSNGVSSFSKFDNLKFGTDNLPLVLMADVDGNGLTDIVGFDANQLQVALSAGPVPDVIYSITDGYGANYKLEYKSISDTSIYTNNSKTNGLGHNTLSLLPQHQSPVFNLQNVLGGNSFVVSTYSIQNNNSINIGAPFKYNYSYKYSDATMNLNGRGWLGYRTKTTFDRQTDKQSVLTFNNNLPFPLSGTIASKENFCSGNSFDKKCSSGDQLSRIDFTYLNCLPGQKCSSNQQDIFQPYKNVYQVLMTDRNRDYYDYGTQNFTIGESYQFDQFGNLTLKTYKGYLDTNKQDQNSNDNVYTYNSYFNDTTSNRIGFKKATLVSSSSDQNINNISCDNNPNFNNTADFSLSTKSYDANMNVLSKCIWANDTKPASWMSFNYTYDQFGNKVSTTDPNNATTKYTFETDYNTYKDQVIKPKDEQGQTLPTIYYGYDPRFGTKVAKQDYNGHISIIAQDNFGRQTASQGPLPEELSGVNGNPNLVTKYVTGSASFAKAQVVTLNTISYQSKQEQLFQDHQTLQSWTTGNTPEMREDQLFVDALGRQFQSKKVGGCETDKDVIQLAVHDSENNVIRQSLPFYEGNTKYWNKKYFDIYNRAIRSATVAGMDGKDSTITTLDYKGFSNGHNVTQVQAANTSDSFTKSVEFKFSFGKSVASSMLVAAEENALTNFSYDRLARPVLAADPTGTLSNISYNSRGKHSSIRNDPQGKISFSYNKEGQLIAKTDNNGTIQYQYDKLGRKISRTLPDGTVFKYAYDNKNAKNGQGKLTSKSKTLKDGTLIFNYSYDYSNYGQLAQKVVKINGAPDSYTLKEQHDPLGRMTQFEYPDGSVMNWKFNQCHLSDVTLGNTTFASYSNYNALGNPTTIAYGNQTTNSYKFSPAGHLLNHTIEGSDQTELLNDAFTFNGLNFITEIKDQTNGAVNYSQTFEYRNLRLTEAAAPGTYGTKNYKYDNGGNLLLKDDVTYTYNRHQVISGKKGNNSNFFSASYDNIGNLTEKTFDGTTWNYNYNDLNQLLNAYKKGGQDTTHFEYNGKGQRILKTKPDGSITYYIHKYYQVTSFKNGATQNTKYVADPIGKLASVTTSSNSGNTEKGTPQKGTLYFHRNYLNSTVLTTKSDGSLSSRPVYTPYGQLYKPIKNDDFSIKYTGQELDESTGLYYYNARFYDPAIGHFTTADDGLGAKMLRQDAFNRYEYTLGNPVSYNDPTGKFGIGCGVGVTGGLLSIGGGLTTALWGTTYNDKSTKKRLIIVGSITAVGGTVAAIGGCIANKVYNNKLENLQSQLNSQEERIKRLEEQQCTNQLNNAGSAVSSADALPSPCFTAGTPISSECGPQKIEDIQIGDKVWSYDEESGENSLQEVVQLFRKSVDTLVFLKVSNQLIECTLDHPFWLPENQGWRSASKLKPGDVLLSLDGSTVSLQSIIIKATEAKVYNFEVANTHTYYASASKILVHNDCSCDCDDDDDSEEEEEQDGNGEEDGEDEGSGESDGMGDDTDLGADDTTTTASEGESAEAENASQSAAEDGSNAAGDGAETAEAGTDTASDAGAEAGGEAAEAVGEAVGEAAGESAGDITLDVFLDFLAFLLL